MRAVYKYLLEKSGLNLIRMPDEATALHVGMQNSRVYIWMLVDDDKPIEARQLWLHGTGWNLAEMPPTVPYVGTAHTDTSLVWHVFDGWYALGKVEQHG